MLNWRINWSFIYFDVGFLFSRRVSRFNRALPNPRSLECVYFGGTVSGVPFLVCFYLIYFVANMRICAYPNCHHSEKEAECRMHRVPISPRACTKWMQVRHWMGSPRKLPLANFLCSCHFNGGHGLTKDNPMPDPCEVTWMFWLWKCLRKLQYYHFTWYEGRVFLFTEEHVFYRMIYHGLWLSKDGEDPSEAKIWVLEYGPKKKVSVKNSCTNQAALFPTNI